MPNYKRKIRRAARRQGVRPSLLVAQLNAESGLNPNARSPAGAQGIAQFMPGTAKSYGVNLNDNNPNDDIRGAARMMHDLLHQFGGDERKALAAYNAGPGAVQKYHGVPPYAETRAYVSKILNAAGKKGASPAPRSAGGGYRTISASSTTPGLDNSAARQQLKLAYLQDSHNPDALLQLASGLSDAQDRAPVTTTTSRRVRMPGDPSSVAGGSGGHVVVASTANRPGAKLHRDVIRFVRRTSSIAGRPLTIGTGTNHSRLTVNGTESDHWRGEGADVPLTGRALIRAGQAALIAAGMPKKQARKQTGGGFNVGGWQVIFNTDAPGWGDHTTHLHVGRQR